MTTRLYADDRCVEEIEYDEKINGILLKLANIELNGEYSEAPKSESKKKSCNCPNCGAPITSYICEYCGTIFDEDKYKQSLVKKKQALQKERDYTEQRYQDTLNALQGYSLQAAQEFQQEHLLNMLNAYHPEVQIMNLRDSVNYSMARMRYNINTSMLQSCNTNTQDTMKAYTSQVSALPCQEPKEHEVETPPASQADEELAKCMMLFVIGMAAFLIFCLVVTAVYNAM